MEKNAFPNMLSLAAFYILARLLLLKKVPLGSKELLEIAALAPASSLIGSILNKMQKAPAPLEVRTSKPDMPIEDVLIPPITTQESPIFKSSSAKIPAEKKFISFLSDLFFGSPVRRTTFHSLITIPALINLYGGYVKSKAKESARYGLPYKVDPLSAFVATRPEQASFMAAVPFILQRHYGLKNVAKTIRNVFKTVVEDVKAGAKV